MVHVFYFLNKINQLAALMEAGWLKGQSFNRKEYEPAARRIRSVKQAHACFLEHLTNDKYY